jgi:glycerophosphoryl diester phosphodiesterase
VISTEVLIIGRQIIIGHKGASGHAPENTLLSFRKAWQYSADMIELDLHETLDGELVCIHDSTVDRTTNGKGEVHSLTFSELKELDAGNGEKIPLLEEVLEFAKGKLQVNIELKVSEVEKKVLGIVERYRMFSDVIISSFYHATLTIIRNLSDLATTAILINKPKDDLVQYALDLKANAINPHYELDIAEIVDDAHRVGLKVYPWTVNESDAMKRLFSLQVDGLITDFPDRAANILRNKT